MFLVTAASGSVGSQIVERLLSEGEKVRVALRDPGKASRWDGRVEVVTADYSQPEAFRDAFSGVEAAFLMNTGPAGEPFEQLLAAAKAAGVQRIVFLSTILAGDAESEIGLLHKAKEDAIRASGLQGRYLRPGSFMTNTLQWSGSIKAEGVVYNPTAKGKVAAIAAEDIAAVAVRALQSSDLEEETFILTGDELLSVPEQVAIVSEVLGRPLRCVDIPVESAIQGMIGAGVPPQIATAVGRSFEGIRNGRILSPTDTVERITGRRPATFREWAERNVSRFA